MPVSYCYQYLKEHYKTGKNTLQWLESECNNLECFEKAFISRRSAHSLFAVLVISLKQTKSLGRGLQPKPQRLGYFEEEVDCLTRLD